MRERAGENRLKLWLFFEADRRLIAAVSALAVFCSLVVLGALSPGAVGLLRSGDPVGTTFQAFIGAIVTGVTLVVTLNQLVLSQEFGTIDQQQERYSGTMDVRAEIADRIGPDIAPSDPSAFLNTLVVAAAADAEAVRDALADDTSEGVSEAVTNLADSIQSNADAVTDQLDDAAFGTFDVISGALDFNYSLKVFDARRIRTEYEDDLSDPVRQRFDELIRTLELFAPAREHVKTLYIQSELIDLSRYVLASAVPALVVTIYMVLFYEVGVFGGAVLGIPSAVFVVSGAVTIALVPFMILLSYILRIASITRRTLAIGPFTLRDTADTDE